MTMLSPIRQSVALIGAGTQGRRLAYMWSSRGSTVHLVDPQESQLQASVPYVERLRTESGKSSADWGLIKTSTPKTLRSVLQDVWLVVECVPENLNLKRNIVAQLDEVAPEDTIIASNSSSFGISDIVEGLQLRNQRRILSAHCYWPPETAAIEIMGHQHTDPLVVSYLLDQCKIHGFTPFHVRKDSTGYLYNRIWAAIKRETLLVLSEGVGTPQEVDEIFKDVLKTPKGPCEQMDVVGLDVVLDIEKHYAETREGLPTQPRDYLEKMISKGLLGVKSGRGFYDWDGEAGPKAERAVLADHRL